MFSARHRLLCARLIAARKASGLTQVDVALRLRRHQSFVSKYESGERRLDVFELLDLLEVLQIDAVEFVRALHAKPARGLS